MRTNAGELVQLGIWHVGRERRVRGREAVRGRVVLHDHAWPEEPPSVEAVVAARIGRRLGLALRPERNRLPDDRRLRRRGGRGEQERDQQTPHAPTVATRGAGAAPASRPRTRPPSRPCAAPRTESASRRSPASAARRARRVGARSTDPARAYGSYPRCRSRRSVASATPPASTSEEMPILLPHVITAATKTPPGQ